MKHFNKVSQFLITAFTGVVMMFVLSVAHATESGKEKILLVAANQLVPERLGWPVGFWAAELTHPYDEFVHAGYEVVIASPQGGKIYADAYSDPRHESGYSAHDIMSFGFLTSPVTAPLLNDTLALNQVDPKDFAAIVVLGGQSPMFTFRENTELKQLIKTFYESGRPTAALCHGVSALVDVKLSSGKYLVKGKKLTGFSLAEDQYVDEILGQQLFEWYVEPALKARGAKYRQNGMWADYALADGNLITGQQQNSGRSVARLVLKQLAKNK